MISIYVLFLQIFDFVLQEYNLRGGGNIFLILTCSIPTLHTYLFQQSFF